MTNRKYAWWAPGPFDWIDVGVSYCLQSLVHHRDHRESLIRYFLQAAKTYQEFWQMLRFKNSWPLLQTELLTVKAILMHNTHQAQTADNSGSVTVSVFFFFLCFKCVLTSKPADPTFGWSDLLFTIRSLWATIHQGYPSPSDPEFKFSGLDSVSVSE